MDDAEEHGSPERPVCPWMLNEGNFDPNVSLLIYAKYISKEIQSMLLSEGSILV